MSEIQPNKKLNYLDLTFKDHQKAKGDVSWNTIYDFLGHNMHDSGDTAHTIKYSNYLNLTVKGYQRSWGKLKVHVYVFHIHFDHMASLWDTAHWKVNDFDFTFKCKLKDHNFMTCHMCFI